MNKISKLLVLVGMVTLLVAGCGQGTKETDTADNAKQEETQAEASAVDETTYAYDGGLTIVGGQEAIEVPYNEIYGMTSVEANVTHTSSSGEVNKQTVKGVLLEDILKLKGESKQNYTDIRFVAGDGYAIVVPAEVFKSKDVILAYEFDGAPLEEKAMPLRVAINDERSMYYVSNLTSIELISNATAVSETMSEKQLVFMETAFVDLPSEDYMYYDSNDQVIMTQALIDNFVSDKGEFVDFVATDGFEKSEDMTVVDGGFIKTTGEDAPLFTGKDLPKGMNVKSILKMTVNETAFISVNSGIASLETFEVDGDLGVKLSEVIKAAGLNAEMYVITASDGYTKEVSQDEIEIGVAYVNSSGTVTIKFDDGNSKSSKVKNALTIAASAGDKEATVEKKADEEKTEAAWTVTFEGLSDGAFDFDSDRAERKLEKIALHTERMKNDEKKPEDWNGYRVLDILNWLKVDEFSSLVIVSADGYEVELLSAMIDEETLLADVRDGEAMTDPENMVQFVQNTEFATNWVKGVAKIIIK